MATIEFNKERAARKQMQVTTIVADGILVSQLLAIGVQLDLIGQYLTETDRPMAGGSLRRIGELVHDLAKLTPGKEK